MSEYFPKPKYLRRKVKVELDLSNRATKVDLKNKTGLQSSDFAKKVDLVGLKSEIDNSDINKLEKVPTGLSSLKSKVDKLDVDKLVTVSVDLSKVM